MATDHSISSKDTSQMQTHQGKVGAVETFLAILKAKGILGFFDGLSAAWWRALTYS
jgi:hypothetical protein